MNIVISETIKHLRTEKGISQEKLAERMNVTVQAVSKWENNLSCPDISLLPELSDFFGVSIDYLITGKNADAIYESQLPDDNVLRIIQAKGRQILDKCEYDPELIIKLKMPKISEQPQLAVEIWGSCSVDGDINGNVQCGNGVNCGNIGGDVACGDGVICGNVGGSIQCGDGVICGNVGNNIKCGDGINCGNIGGNVTTAADINCGNIFGDICNADGDITCQEIKGNANCGGDIIYTQK